MSTEKKPISPLGPDDFQRCLAELKPQIGNYEWIWSILRTRARNRSGSSEQRFPSRGYSVLQRFLDPKKPYSIGRTDDGTFFLADYRDLYALYSSVLRNHDSCLINFIKERLNQDGGGYLDVGTNMGVVAASVARFLGERKEVIAFEPFPETAKRAAATFALNGLKNVRLFPCAVGNENTEIELYSPVDRFNHSATATLHRVHYEGVTWSRTKVVCHRLDDLMKWGLIGKVGGIKIDVEGHELQVVRGAHNLLAQNKPNIIYEFNPQLASQIGWTTSDVATEIDRVGKYEYHVLYEDKRLGEYPPPETLNDTVNIYCDNHTVGG